MFSTVNTVSTEATPLYWGHRCEGLSTTDQPLTPFAVEATRSPVVVRIPDVDMGDGRILKSPSTIHCSAVLVSKEPLYVIDNVPGLEMPVAGSTREEIEDAISDLLLVSWKTYVEATHESLGPEAARLKRKLIANYVLSPCR